MICFCSLSVMRMYVLETGMSGQKLDRRFLAEELNVVEDKSGCQV